MNKLDRICLKALQKWGGKVQIQMLIEEMAELTVELCHLLRGRESFMKIGEEIADVELMIHQIKLEYGLKPDVKDWKEKKLERLEEKLK